MSLNLLDSHGTPLDKQKFTWKELVQKPISKLDDDAFTRVRIILMNGIETEAVFFQHNLARMNKELRPVLANIRRVEQHQRTMINWLLGSDHSPLETTIAYEQTAIEVTASVALNEPDPYIKQMYRYGMLEDFDHLYRYSALLDRVEGKDANSITQCYSDIAPGRPTIEEHRHPEDDLRKHYNARKADPLTKLNALTIVAGEQQTLNFYSNIGPMFSDPVARMLYAEIASIEEQHVSHYESMIDPDETLLEKWLLHEASEVYNYYSCVESETNPRIKKIWERFLDYELGHLEIAKNLFKDIERRDPEEVLPKIIPKPIKYKSHRDFVRETLNAEVNFRAHGTEIGNLEEDPQRSKEYRDYMNSEGSPSFAIARNYHWEPGGEAAHSDQINKKNNSKEIHP